MENLGFGLEITAVGMGLVFALLALLWGVLTALGRLDRPAARGEAGGVGPGVEVSGPDADGLEPGALAAVAIAVAAHVAARRRQAAPEMRTTRPGSQLHASRWLATGRARETRGWTPRR